MRDKWTREGRTLLRNGVPIFDLARVDLTGDEDFAVRPSEADDLVELIRILLDGRRIPSSTETDS